MASESVVAQDGMMQHKIHDFGELPRLRQLGQVLLQHIGLQKRPHDHLPNNSVEGAGNVYKDEAVRLLREPGVGLKGLEGKASNIGAAPPRRPALRLRDEPGGQPNKSPPILTVEELGRNVGDLDSPII
eukprot:7974030-Alexandrium_andersonii.AAC.1